jgi:glycosyltransferase involved in cell wall biosynthesis
MRIYYLFPCAFPSERAHTIQVFHTVNELAKQGAQVLFTPKRNGNITRNDQIESFYGEKIHPNLTIRFLPPNKRLRSLALRFNILTEGLRGSFIYCRKLGWMRYVNFLSRRRNAVEIHKLSSKHVKAARNAAQVVTISHPLKEHLQSEGIDPKKITVIGSGFSSLFFPLEKQTNAEKPRIIYFGKLTEDKGVELIIQALQYVDCEALIIGGDLNAYEDHNRKRLETIAKQIGVNDRIHFTGFLKQQDVAKMVRRGDIGIVPTLPNGTQGICNSPLKLFEYLALGLPCVATDMPAFTSIQCDGKAIKYFKAECPKALSEKVKEITQEEGCYNFMSEAAIEVSKEFTWPKRAKRVISLITNSTQ